MERWRWCLLQWALPFFGLPRNHSTIIHTQIFEMAQYGNGFTVLELYQLPTKIRNFYYNKLVDMKKRENDEAKKVERQMKASKVRIKR